MSNLGVQAVYGLLAERTPYVPELYFYQEGLGLHRHRDALAPRRVQLRDYDVVAFSLSFELLYVNLHRILAEGGVGVTAQERPGTPLVIAGGYPLTANPLPVAELLDAAFTGEAEEAFPPFLDEVLRELPRLKSPQGALARGELLARWHGRPGFWCPHSGRDRTLAVRNVLRDLSGYETVSRIITSRTAFASRMLLQTSRGCGAACAFCLAGHTTQPLRVLPEAEVLRRARLAQCVTDRLGIIAAAPSDHPQLASFTRRLAAEGFRLSFSSLRLSALDEELVASLLAGGQRTFTVAPEVLDEGYRRRIGKPFPNNAEILARTQQLLRAGVPRLKFYFMLGFEFEDDAYLRALGEWLTELDAVSRQVRPRGEPPLTFSFSFFVPKAHTPLELAPMPGVAELTRRRKLVKRHYRGRGRLKFESAAWSLVQERLSRGGREVLQLVEFLAAHGLKTATVNRAVQEFALESAAANPVRTWPQLR